MSEQWETAIIARPEWEIYYPSGQAEQPVHCVRGFAHCNTFTCFAASQPARAGVVDEKRSFRASSRLVRQRVMRLRKERGL